jgi:bifunctional NMN adenylyltransferase/nudix hydrolase
MTNIVANTKTAAIEDVGVIIGRFQTPYLHQGHKDLIERVVKSHKTTVIFLGVSPNKRSRRNPLDFEARRIMILQDFPGVSVLPLSDMKDDKDWSHNLDAKIKEAYSFASIRLYGGRDSFITHYTGSFPITEIESTLYHSATSLRDEAGHDIKESAAWRAGVIYGAYNQFPKVWATVDIAPIRYNVGAQPADVLLARKPGEKEWRFIGGFSDPTDHDFERVGKRETYEEANIEVCDLTYICSQRIDDWRYKDDVDKVITTFFAATYTHGRPEPKDDIEQLGWFPIDNSFRHIQFVSAHVNLAAAFLNFTIQKGIYASVPNNKSVTV